MTNARIISLSSFLITLIAFVAGCYTVPGTGRSALNLYPDSELAVASSAAFEEMKQEVGVSTNAEHNRIVQEVGRRIAAVAADDIPNADWEFVVFDSEQVNAFAMPGGKVGFYTGMFDVAQGEDGIAVVMGHEVAHVAAKHSNERVSQQLVLQAVGIGVGYASKGQSEAARQIIMQLYGVGTTIGVALPHNRAQESEADEIGLMYAARAGYDPREAVPFWQRMAQLSDGAPPEFLSTHPSSNTRAQRLKELMPKALAEYQRATGND